MFYKITNLIKYNYELKNTYIKITKLNKNDFKIINLFIKFNIVKYVKKNNNKYYIYLKYFKNKVIFKNIKNLYKPSKPFFLKVSEIIKLNKKKNKIFVLSTNKGLITNYEAEKNKIGGIPILIIIV